ncbi:hypothetical protein [Puia sp.]|jgi:hypothetical protein|uniref:hypothetical protein n=1 Tax=Puia sp. TaxID=2045100 RepID=UPI002F427F08
MVRFGARKALTLLLGAVVVFGLSSCLGPHKINKWVAQHYRDEPPADPPRKKNEPIAISSALPESGVKLSETQKNWSHLLPLLFYWQFDYRNTCTLNPEIGINNFTSTVFAYAGHGLKQKITGYHLELKIEQLPQAFLLDDKGHLIWVIVTAVGWEKLSVQPTTKDMVVAYRLLGSNNEELKKGTITIADNEKNLTLGMFQSLRKMTKQHLSNYDANITAMTKRFVDKLVTEL